jgi:hypothetical protein
VNGQTNPEIDENISESALKLQNMITPSLSSTMCLVFNYNYTLVLYMASTSDLEIARKSEAFVMKSLSRTGPLLEKNSHN